MHYLVSKVTFFEVLIMFLVAFLPLKLWKKLNPGTHSCHLSLFLKCWSASW